jgi:hypothetical protein
VDTLLGILGGLGVLALARGCWIAGSRTARRLGKGAGEAAAAAALAATVASVWLVNREPSRIPLAILLSPAIYLEFAYFLPTVAYFFGLAAARAPKPGQGRAVAALTAVLAAYAAVHVFLAFEARSLPQLRAEPPEGPVCRQSTSWSCGPAACVTLLRAHGIGSTEREMGELSLCYPKRGTTVPRFRRGLASKLAKEGSALRVVAEDRLSVAELDAFPKPALLGIKFTLFVDHAVVLMGRDDAGRYLLADPLPGKVVAADPAEFERRFSGEAIALVP